MNRTEELVAMWGPRTPPGSSIAIRNDHQPQDHFPPQLLVVLKLDTLLHASEAFGLK